MNRPWKFATVVALVATTTILLPLLLRREGGAPSAPLVLDLDGDGIELLDPDRSRVYFDIDHDGYAERIGWAAVDDGVLVIDRNGNGAVDDVAELLATLDWKLADLHGAEQAHRLASGFNMLREWDDNGDGVVDESDAAFGQILVWRDSNDDGSGQADELRTLSQVGIAFLNTASTPNFERDGENTVTEVGEFGRSDGTKGGVVSVRFGFDGTMTRFLGSVTIDPATEALPKLNGYGMAKPLSAAMSEDLQLMNMVADFTKLTAAEMPELESRIEEILFRWYRTDGINPSSRGPNIDARWVATLERVYGKPWRDRSGSPDPNANAASLLAEAWRDVKSYASARLLAQAPLGQVLFPGLAYKGMAFVVLPDTVKLDDVLFKLRLHSPSEPSAKLRYWNSALLVLDELYSEFEEVVSTDDRNRFEEYFIAAIDAALVADSVAQTYGELSGRDKTVGASD